MFATDLRCRACDTAHPRAAIAACEACGAPLDPAYDWERLRSVADRDRLARRPRTIWRYRELLPVDDDPRVAQDVGWTPLVEAPALARELGVARLWIKNDGFSFPTLSFKDRVVAVAINKALELGLSTVAAPSTGNLANAVAAHAARAGLPAWVIVPDDIERGKLVGSQVFGPRIVRVRGTYDDANRLARAAATRLGWGVVNVNLRPYYGEGSKTMAFEIAEQLGWRAPSAVVSPMAGGSLVTKLVKGFRELETLGWIDGDTPRAYGVQAEGCAPIVRAIERGDTTITPVRPATAARSIAIGDPVDGAWAADAVVGSAGWAVAVSDDAMREGITLLARMTGIFTETAGGVTVSGARALAAAGRLGPDDEVVLCITGHGLKTIEAVDDDGSDAPVIDPDIAALEALAR
jgi:threonine synthase